MESTSDTIDDGTLDFKFNSEFARSLSTDINKYDGDFSHESVAITSNDEEFLVETSAFFIENINKSDEDKEKQLWSQNNKKTKHQISKSDDSSDAEILRLRKECQNLLEENRRLSNNYTHQSQCAVQNNRLEMLQWQLTQAEQKNEMCIKLLREVAHFLEKCNTRFESSHHQEQQQHLNEKIIERSKSISHISTEKYINSSKLATIGNTPNRNRTHSISNLSHSMSTKFFTDLSLKDFAWRLSPKHKFEGNNSTISEIDDVFETTTVSASEDVETEKISKESHQLIRLIRNTINSMMTINNNASTTQTEPTHHDTKLNFSELRSNTSEHLSIPTSEKCDKHKSSSRFSALENESGFSSMSSFSFNIPSSNVNLNEIGIPSITRKEVIFDEQQSENVENFNVLWV